MLFAYGKQTDRCILFNPHTFNINIIFKTSEGWVWKIAKESQFARTDL